MTARSSSDEEIVDATRRQTGEDPQCAPPGVSERTVARLPPIPLGHRELIWAILLTAPFLGIHMLTPVKLPWGMLAFLCSLPGLIVALLALKAYQQRRHDALAPSLTLTSHGLELRRSFRRDVRMEFADITQVVAVSGLDGSGEATMTLVLYSSQRRIAVGDELLHGSSLLARIEQLPGFDAHAYAGSWADENDSNQALLSKRTVILRQPAPRITVHE